MEEKEKNSKLFGDSYANSPTNDTTNNENQISFSNIEDIDNYHIVCSECRNYFFIDFTESKMSIKITCLCYNNKEISIEDFFGKDIRINDSSDTLSDNNSDCNCNNYEGIKCNCSKNNNIFKSYCETCRLNKCTICEINCKNKSHKLIDLKSIIKEKQLNEVKEIVNKKKNKTNPDSNFKENFKLIETDDNNLETIPEEDVKAFYKLINIIIEAYEKYPDFILANNINNIFHYFNLKDNNRVSKNIDEKEDKNKNLKLNEKDDEITIKYINNNSSIQLFNEKNSLKKIKVKLI